MIHIVKIGLPARLLIAQSVVLDYVMEVAQLIVRDAREPVQAVMDAREPVQVAGDVVEDVQVAADVVEDAQVVMVAEVVMEDAKDIALAVMAVVKGQIRGGMDKKLFFNYIKIKIKQRMIKL